MATIITFYIPNRFRQRVTRAFTERGRVIQFRSQADSVMDAFATCVNLSTLLPACKAEYVCESRKPQSKQLQGTN